MLLASMVVFFTHELFFCHNPFFFCEKILPNLNRRDSMQSVWGLRWCIFFVLYWVLAFSRLLTSRLASPCAEVSFRKAVSFSVIRHTCQLWLGLCCCVMHLCIRGRPGAASPLDRLFDLASRLSPLFAVVMAFDSWAAFAAELAEYGGVDASTILTSAPTASCHGADTSPGTGETVEVPASPTPAIHRSRLGRSRLDSELASALRTFSPEDFALWGPPAADIDSAGELEA